MNKYKANKKEANKISHDIQRNIGMQLILLVHNKFLLNRYNEKKSSKQ